MSCTVAFVKMLAVAGATVTVATGALDTVTSDVPFTPSLVAVIVAVPAVTPVTRPLLLFTVAADALELHTTVRPVNGLPPASFSVAVSCTVAFVKMLAVAGATVTVATGTGVAVVTVIVEAPLCPSLVAVIVAEPAATPVTSPLGLTVAAELLLDHAMPRPVRMLPPASFKVAVSGSVCPTTTVPDTGLTLTVATGTGVAVVTVIVEVPLWPPLVAVIVADPAATPLTSPLLSTMAAAVLPLDQATAKPASELPAVSSTVAVSCTACPAATLAVGGVTVTDPTTGQVTVTLASPVTLPG